MKQDFSAARDRLLFLEAVFFSFVKEIRLCCTQIHHFWTPVSLQQHNIIVSTTCDARYKREKSAYVLLLHCALSAIVRIRDADAAAHDAAALVRAVVALVADAHERVRVNVRVADHALAVACIKEKTFQPSARAP